VHAAADGHAPVSSRDRGAAAVPFETVDAIRLLDAPRIATTVGDILETADPAIRN
jgi:hypothetical protein